MELSEIQKSFYAIVRMMLLSGEAYTGFEYFRLIIPVNQWRK